MSNENEFVASVNRLESLIDSNQTDLKRDVESLIDRRFSSLKEEVNKLKCAQSALDQINNLMALWDDRCDLSELPNRIRTTLEGATANNQNQAHHLVSSEVGDNVTVENSVNNSVEEETSDDENGEVQVAPNDREELNRNRDESLPEQSNGTNQCSENDQQVDKGDHEPNEPANDGQNQSPTTKQSKTRKRRRADKSLVAENSSFENSLTSDEVSSPGPMTNSKRTRVSSLDRRENAEQLSSGSRVDLCESDNQNGIDSSGEGEIGVEQIEDDDNETELGEEEGAHPKIEIVKLKCLEDGCEDEVASRVELHDHLRVIHHISPHRCLAERCGERFEQWIELGNHVKHNHSNISTWQCPHCTKTFKSQHRLYHHLHWYHFEGQFKCGYDGCHYDRVATLRSEIRTHQDSVHRKTTIYTCQFHNCGKSFNRKYHFNRHQRIHSVAKSFRCDWIGCGKSFTEKYKLDIHQRIHQKVKPYKCTWNMCNYASTQHSNVIIHIRTQHFNLPASQKAQRQLGIEDNRNPRDYLLNTTHH